MKQIKAYVRCEKAEEVVHALENSGVKDLIITDVKSVGKNIDPNRAKYSFECVEKYQKVVRLEFFCSERDVNKYVKILLASAYTGMQGDGLIAVSEVKRVIAIQSGAAVQKALAY